MKTLRIATRGSRLALAQTHQIRHQLLQLDPNLDITIVTITTQGDVDKSDFLHQSRSVGLFTSEVQNALLDNRADLAVHSLKDLPTADPEALTIAAMPQRESPADVLISRHGLTHGLSDLAPNSTVGTSSLRRIAQVRQLRPDLDCQPLRGNIETRIQKAQSGQYDAIVLAEAGLRRLDLGQHISAVLETSTFIPAPAQGALAVQVRTDDQVLGELVGKLDHGPTRLAVTTERQVLAGLHGGCSIPLGVYARIDNQSLTLSAMLSSVDGKEQIRHDLSGPDHQAPSLAQDMVDYLLHNGARDLLNRIRMDH